MEEEEDEGERGVEFMYRGLKLLDRWLDESMIITITS